MPDSEELREIKKVEGSEDDEQARFLDGEFQKGYKFDHTARRWHIFNPTTGIWAPDQRQQTQHAVVKAARARLSGLANDATMAEDTNAYRQKLKRRLLDTARVDSALVALSRWDDYSTDGSEWDQKPNLLGVGNGVVDLERNALVVPDPKNLVTKTTGHKFVPLVATEETFWQAAFERAPQFVAFLDQITSNEGLTMGWFLLEWFGYSLFGYTKEHHFLIMVGSGRNGKGTLAKAMRMAFGEYSAPPETQVYMKSKLGATPSSSARADLMVLKGRRAAIMEEPEGGEFNEDLLKAHSGDSPISARALYSNNVIQWQPTHSITFLTNAKPRLTDIGPSMQDRVMVAEFLKRYEGEARDLLLDEKLRTEVEGIQAILIWMAQHWFQKDSEHGIVLPQRVLDASREYIEANDPVGDALREVFEVGKGLIGRSQACYDSYAEWHNQTGREGKPMSSVMFAQALELKGFRKTKTRAGMVWSGIRPLTAMEVADGDDDATE